MAQQTLNAGSPPIVWSTVEDAFTKINANFDEIYATIGGTLGSVVDFETLNSNVSPAITETYDLGSPSFRWKDLYLSGSSLYLGPAQITANLSGVVNLPSGSTVGGELIRNPIESSFKTIAVAGQSNIDADSTTDTLNVVSGNSGLTITTNATTDTITFTSNAISSIVGTANQIGVSTVSGVATLTNLGVLSLTGEVGGISVSGSAGDITITNLGAKRIIAGTGMSVNPLGGTGNVTVTNEGALTAFNRVLVNGDTGNVISADGSVSILRINSGTGVSLTKDPLTDTITISASTSTDFDLKGSVFGDDSTKIVDAVENKVYATNGFYGDLKGSVVGDDSTMLVDGVDGRIVGPVYTSTLRTADLEISLGDNTGSNQGLRAVAVGALAGSEDQGTRAVSVGNQAGQYRQGARGVAIGPSSGFFEQGDSAVAIGDNAGQSSQGDYAIAVGYYAGHNNQSANSIILNASSSILNGPAAAFYANPVRNQTGASGVVQYDATTKEISYSSSIAGTFTGNVFTTLIDSADSSAITVTPAVIFNADINVENDIRLSNIHASIRGTDKIKFVPSNADELSYNVRLDVYSESTIEPRLALDTPDGVDLTLSSGMAGIVVSKIHGRVNLSAGNNAFIVRENGSWAMTASDAAPGSPTVGVYIANGTTWDPASKGGSRPYPVFYDGASFNALY
jgi:hypothetical protein